MECPACGSDCVQSAPDILRDLPTRFLPCEKCSMRVLDKRSPLPSLEYGKPCSCGKRFIDEVFAHMYVIMQEEGDLAPRDPLIAVGSPLIHPGMAMDRPPFLRPNPCCCCQEGFGRKRPGGSLSRSPKSGALSKAQTISRGLSHLILMSLRGSTRSLPVCDVRADIYPLATGPLVVYKQQSLIHVEFPRAGYPKLRSVAAHVGTPPVLFLWMPVRGRERWASRQPASASPT